MNILSLPIEIIQLIGNVRFSELSRFYSYRSQPQDGQVKTLRLVCSQFNRAFETQVLSTLVILVTVNTLMQSIDMLSAFASRNNETSRAVQHARALKIKYLSPIMALDPELFSIPQSEEAESQDPFPTNPPRLICRLASAISSLKQGFKWVCNLSSFS